MGCCQERSTGDESSAQKKRNETRPRGCAAAGVAVRILRKLGLMLIIFLGITIIIFWVIHLAPGSTTDMHTTLNPQAG